MASPQGLNIASTPGLAIHGGHPVRDTFLVFGRPRVEEAEIAEVVRTLRSGWLGTGPRVREFEKKFARYVNAEHAVALNSCTAGLHLALKTLGIGPGDEVITTPMTFVATANVIVHCGAVPVFADVDRHTMVLDPDAAEGAISPRTKAILPVHFGGRACDMDALQGIAQRHGLHLIEDAAHAIETTSRGRKIGSIGDITCFSFYVTKNVMTGEGGMVTTNDANWARRMRALSLHGLSHDAWNRFSSSGSLHYDAVEPGFKYNMMDIQAAIGIHQLSRIEAAHARRKQIWQQYDLSFCDLPVFRLADTMNAQSRHAMHLYTLLLDLDNLTQNRDFVAAALKHENIGTGIHYKPVHLHSYYRQRFGFRQGCYPDAEWVAARTLSLPLGPVMTDEDVNDVIVAVRKVLESIRR